MTPTHLAMPILAKQIRSVHAFRRPVMRAVPLAATALAVALSTGCKDYLTGLGKDQDPNHVTTLSDPGPLYLSVQTAQAVQFEGGLGRMAAMYVQQIAGPGRQQQGVDTYQSQPTDVDSYFGSVYAAGGLVDVRAIQELAKTRGDSTMGGIAKVYEALIIGTATSFWGDIPYRQANQPNTTPALDPQLQVYADVQAKLDTAITFLSKTGRTNAGPGQFELVYGGAGAAALRSLYTRVAYTLKARYYMHLAERDAANHARARTAALNGISSTAGDMNWFNASNATSQNIFYQFQGQRTDLGPSTAMINLMGSRISAGMDTPDRMKFYFLDYCRSIGAAGLDRNNPASYRGYRPGGNPNLPGGAGAPAGAKCPDGGDASQAVQWRQLDPGRSALALAATVGGAFLIGRTVSGGSGIFGRGGGGKTGQ